MAQRGIATLFRYSIMTSTFTLKNYWRTLRHLINIHEKGKGLCNLQKSERLIQKAMRVCQYSESLSVDHFTGREKVKTEKSLAL